MAEIIVTGKTVDEAVESGCRQLGVTREMVTVEVLEMPQKRLFMSKPAKVRLTQKEEEFSVHDFLYGDEKKETNKKEAQPQKNKQEEKRPEKRERKEEKKDEKKVQKEVLKEKKKEEKPKPKKEELPVVAEEEEDENLPAETVLEPVTEQQLPDRAKRAYAYLQEMVKAYGVEQVEYAFAKTERGICILISGADAPALIGRRGEVMDALQYLCMVGSSREGGDYCRITLDIEGYRSRREKSLKELANKTMAKVKKNRRSYTLEPMNPYERSIVHSEVQKVEGFSSHSVGSEPNRKVVITMDGVKGGRRRDRREGKPATEERKSIPHIKVSDIPVKKELKSTEEFIGSLYGKIEL